MNERSERTYEKVVNYIQSEIRKGNLQRGERLPPERDLAELLGVSRNSVREALRTMSLMGFISSVHGAGNFLTCDLEQNLSASFRMMLLLGETNYLQVSQLRRGLESETARLAANRILPGQAARLMELAVKMRDESDAGKASLYDQEFHNLLCDASGNKLIRSVFGAIRATVNDFIGTVYVRIMEDKEQAVLLHDAHIQLANALTNHDELSAIRATFTHFEVVNASIQKYELAGRKIL